MGSRQLQTVRRVVLVEDALGDAATVAEVGVAVLPGPFPDGFQSVAIGGGAARCGWFRPTVTPTAGGSSAAAGAERAPVA